MNEDLRLLNGWYELVTINTYIDFEEAITFSERNKLIADHFDIEIEPGMLMSDFMKIINEKIKQTINEKN